MDLDAARAAIGTGRVLRVPLAAPDLDVQHVDGGPAALLDHPRQPGQHARDAKAHHHQPRR